MDYTIAPIPTVYNGRQYRSRLEARWAAFFDLLAWRHEYEPYDLGRWSPDFLLIGSCGSKVLVEIKPVTGFDVEVADKASSACLERRFYKELSAMFLLGVSPYTDNGIINIGWVRLFDHERPGWHNASLVWIPNPDYPEFCADVPVPKMGAITSLGGVFSGILIEHDNFCLPYAEHTMRLWAEASNRVQWKSPR